MTAFAVSTMMTLAMPFASFAAARSCQTGFRPENNCGYTGTNAVSVIQMQDGCVISNRNAIDLYTLLGKGYPNGAVGNNCSSGFQLVFDNLVDVTEPICQAIDSAKADIKIKICADI